MFGPMQNVTYGRPSLRPDNLLSEVFGIDPKSPIAQRPFDGPEFSRRAEKELAAGKEQNLKAANNIAWTALERGFVDDTLLGASIAAATSLDFTLSFLTTSSQRQPYAYFRKLNPEQQARYRELLIARLSAPIACGSCGGGNPGFASTPKLVATAANLYRERDDLFAWQYEGLLRLGPISLASPKPEENLQRSEIVTVIANGNTRAFTERLIAFSEVVIRHFTSAEIYRIAPRIRDIDDDQLNALFRRNVAPIAPSIFDQNKSDRRTIDDAAYRAFWPAMGQRVARVADGKLRQELRERIPERCRLPSGQHYQPVGLSSVCR
jgi:hypothetical protein